MLINRPLVEDSSHKTAIVLDRSPKFSSPAGVVSFIFFTFYILRWIKRFVIKNKNRILRVSSSFVYNNFISE